MSEKIKLFTKTSVYAGVFIAVALIIFASTAIMSGENQNSWVYKIPIIEDIKKLAESSDKKLKGEDRGRINVLLLGMAGQNHDGSYLTDTIILASFEPSSKKVALVSFPRDLTIPMEGYGWRKINHVNAFAEAREAGSGGIAISQALSDILEMPIDYYVRADFRGFVNIIYELGGVEVNVENTLEDFRYPIAGRESAEPYESRFEHLYVEKGLQKMDGELALKFSRSRYASGREGSDFARAKRQQLILEAVKEKLLSKWNIFKPRMISNILDEVNEHVLTNFEIWEIVKLWEMFKDVDRSNITNKVLDNTPNGLLADMITAEGAYILTPRSGDFAEIQYFVRNIFSNAPQESQKKVAVEKATIEVRNGTWINGLASRTALDMEKYGFEVIRVGNCSRQNFQKTVIYDLTFGEKLESLKILKEKTTANVSFDIPQWLKDDIAKQLANETNPEQPDFLLVLGQDADKTASGMKNEEK